jgi:glycosyltransferase involved in cell wall biosynthesis
LKVGVIHDSLNYAGGAERVCLKTIEAAKEAGHRVVLATIEKTDWRRLEGVFGRISIPDEERPLVKGGIAAFRLYASLLTPLAWSWVKGHSDLTICTNEDLMMAGSDFGYMHYVPFCLSKSVVPKVRHPLVDTYAFAFRQLQLRSLRNPEKSTLISNSEFTRGLVARLAGFRSSVIYPPVDVDRFSPVKDEDRARLTILTLGRLSPEKNFEVLLQIARRHPTARFLIACSSSGALSDPYYRRLVGIKRKYDLRNTTFLRDPTPTQLNLAISSSNVILNSTVNETFGLVIAEAMAAGVVPLVHRSGGPWVDILGGADGRFGFSYSDLDEACEVLGSLIADRGRISEIRLRCVKRAKVFSDVSFKDKMRKTLRL